MYLLSWRRARTSPILPLLIGNHGAMFWWLINWLILPIFPLLFRILLCESRARQINAVISNEHYYERNHTKEFSNAYQDAESTSPIWHNSNELSAYSGLMPMSHLKDDSGSRRCRPAHIDNQMTCLSSNQTASHAIRRPAPYESDNRLCDQVSGDVIFAEPCGACCEAL